MLQITSIKNGLVIDHIESGMGIKIFNYLNLENTDYKVALIINTESNSLGKKDIIKIEKDNLDDIDYTVLRLLSPSVTINEVRDGIIVNKLVPELPERIENILHCNNPRCITTDEKYMPHSFVLVNKDKGTYRCEYCDEIAKLSEI